MEGWADRGMANVSSAAAWSLGPKRGMAKETWAADGWEWTRYTDNSNWAMNPFHIISVTSFL